MPPMIEDRKVEKMKSFKPWKKEYETKCDAYELDVDEYTKKKKWTKRGLKADLVIYSNVDDMNDLKVCFELHSIQVWWQIFNKKLKKKGSKTRVATFKRFGEDVKETIALRFANPQICQSFIAKWEALTRDWDEYISTDDEDTKDDGKEEAANGNESKLNGNAISNGASHDHEEEKEIESFKKIADKSSFRDLIKLNQLPGLDLVDSANVLREYYFNYGVHKKLHQKYEEMDFAHFSYGKFHNEEHYLSLWMNPDIITSMPFQRPKVNLVVVLDRSESMNESLSVNSASRMDIAQEALKQLFRHTLDKMDRFAIVSFNEEAKVEWPMQLVDDLPYGMLPLRKHILSIRAEGSTDLVKGYRTALNLFDDEFLANSKNDGYYNRIVFMTDYQLDSDDIDAYNEEEGLFGIMKAAASKKEVFTTFMSMGVPIDEKLFHSSFSGVQGCHYMNIETKEELISKFHKEQEFPFMVSPLLFNLKVNLNAKILKAYTTNIDLGDVSRGELLTVDNLFGNMNYSVPFVLKIGFAQTLTLTVSYTFYAEGTAHEVTKEQIIDLGYSADKIKAKLAEQPDYYESIGIRKVVLLCRYVDILRLWLKTDDAVQEHADDGRLAVSDEFKLKFADFAQYFKSEMEVIDDEALRKELVVLLKLSRYVDTVDID